MDTSRRASSTFLSKSILSGGVLAGVTLVALWMSHPGAVAKAPDTVATGEPVTVTTGTRDRVHAISSRPIEPLFNGPTLVMSGFSGVTGQAPAERVIDPDGAVVTLLNIERLGQVFDGREIRRVPYDSLMAKEVGQVFGIAIDDADEPNLYLSATSVFGLPIIGWDKDRDGRPDKLRKGRPDARFMPGLFGANGEQGPGSIWKVDGRTGQVSLFASLKLDGVANSGPGLGNLAFDGVSQQLFASDLDTGMVFRLDMDGNVLETFDHGVIGRGLARQKQVPFDATNRLDISDPSFDVEDPKSWHFADPLRRVWGLAAREGRLFYAVAKGTRGAPEVWSVGIEKDGAFGFDARRELILPGDLLPLEISDIAFASDGSMLLAQRGGRVGSFDFSRSTKPGRAEIVRFRKTKSGKWRRKALPPSGIGSGGLALGPGYMGDGRLDRTACAATLWTSGEALRGADGRMLEGAQARRLDATSEKELSSLVDFNRHSDARPGRGWIGDVAVFGCDAIEETKPVAEMEKPSVIAPAPDPELVPVKEPEAAADLRLVMRSIGDCIRNERDRTYACDFSLRVRNRGEGTFKGPLAISSSFDFPKPNTVQLLKGSGWACSPVRARAFSCFNANTNIASGKASQLTVRMVLPAWRVDQRFKSCAMLGVGASQSQQVSVAQMVMEARGIASGGVDGRMGPKTRRGLTRLQTQLGMPIRAKVGPDLFEALGLSMADVKLQSCAAVRLAAMAAPVVEEDPNTAPGVIEDTPGIIEAPLPPKPQAGGNCDPRTTLYRDNRCVCRYEFMHEASPSECRCNPGRRFVAGRGCVRLQANPDNRRLCDRLTTFEESGNCFCRYNDMRKISRTSCACRGGSVLIPGRGCVGPSSRPVRPAIQCDPDTTIRYGNRCVCAFPNMHQISPTRCVMFPRR